MALVANQEAVLEFAPRLRRLCPSLPDAPALAARLLRIRSRLTGREYQLPLHCTESPGKVCGLLKNLDAVNDILERVSAEVLEHAPGKVAVLLKDGFESPKFGGNGGVGYENAANLLYCLVAEHRCVNEAQVPSTAH
ncbi:hypothetical protein V5799_010869 [Amblyomma americanum]|uniref:Uncharacterized protein n=1 Tax=Amblyomma americanum TaxID=6943 RepID=A0AAQ4EIY7_AMBAM